MAVALLPDTVAGLHLQVVARHMAVDRLMVEVQADGKQPPLFRGQAPTSAKQDLQTFSIPASEAPSFNF